MRIIKKHKAQILSLMSTLSIKLYGKTGKIIYYYGKCLYSYKAIYK